MCNYKLVITTWKHVHIELKILFMTYVVIMLGIYSSYILTVEQPGVCEMTATYSTSLCPSYIGSWEHEQLTLPKDCKTFYAVIIYKLNSLW